MWVWHKPVKPGYCNLWNGSGLTQGVMLTRAFRVSLLLQPLKTKSELWWWATGYRRAIWPRINLLIFWGHLSVHIWALWSFCLLTPCKTRQHFFLFQKFRCSLKIETHLCTESFISGLSRQSGSYFTREGQAGKQEDSVVYLSPDLVTALNHSNYRRGCCWSKYSWNSRI